MPLLQELVKTNLLCLCAVSSVTLLIFLPNFPYENSLPINYKIPVFPMSNAEPLEFTFRDRQPVYMNENACFS